MVTILSPEQVESGKMAEANKIQHRLLALADEENRLTKSVNSLRIEESDTKKRIADTIAQEAHDHDQRTAAMEREVSALEERKKAALEPIQPVIEAAHALKAENEKRSAALDEREKALTAREDAVADREETLLDREDEFKDMADRRTAELNRRENGAKSAEAVAKIQADKISAEWIKFHEAVAKADADLQLRERVVRDGNRENEIIKQSLIEREQKVSERERAVTDKYEALAAATKEFEAKQHHG